MEELSLLDAEELLLRISKGEALADAELQELAALLNASGASELGRKLSVDDIYAYVTVLRRSKAENFRHVLENFLTCEDSLTVALVLETLCLDWGYTEEYLERVFSFALGESWDEEEDVQQTAIKILGEYLHGAFLASTEARKSPSPKEEHVLSLLFSLFDDTELASWTKQTVYFALSRASGSDWDDLPPECCQIDFSPESTDIDQQLLQSLRELLPGMD